jgi:serine/threonine-protein kinase
MADHPPSVLVAGCLFHGRYEVAGCLRAGGMGAVYEVVDQKTRRKRALKVMLPSVVGDADLRARFKLEATITAAIESEHLVETVDADVDAETGAPFVVMELLRGEDLGATLARRRALPPAEVIELLGQAARGLDRTHAAGVVHRDLKPENLFLIQGDDGKPKLKLLDFGIAKIVAESGATLQTTRAMGTPLYMPPEQIRGDGAIGPRADLYALAHVAYTLLAGEPYWREEVASAPALFPVFSRILAGPQEPPTARAGRRRGVALPSAFDAWFLKATAAAPADRFDSASSQIAALAGALSTGALTATVLGEATVPLDPATEQRTVPLASASGSSPFPSLSQTRPDPTTSAEKSTTAAISTELPVQSPRRSATRWLAGLAVVATGALALALFASRPSGEVGAQTRSTSSGPALGVSPSGAVTAVEPAPPPAPPLPAASSAPTATGVATTKGLVPGPSVQPPRALPSVRPVGGARRPGYDPTDTR